MGASSVCELCEVEAAMAYRVNGMAACPRSRPIGRFACFHYAAHSHHLRHLMATLNGFELYNLD